MIAAMPNLLGIEIVQTHIIDLLPLCPVSGNPQKGSTVKVTYKAGPKFLEVYDLSRYVAEFVGGRHWRGHFVRDMEQTLQVMKVDFEEVLEVPVYLEANLILDVHTTIVTIGAPINA